MGSIIGEISGDGKNVSHYHYCNPVCRQLVLDTQEENKYLKQVIEDLRKDKAFLVSLIERRNDFVEEIKFEIQKIKGVDND